MKKPLGYQSQRRILSTFFQKKLKKKLEKNLKKQELKKNWKKKNCSDAFYWLLANEQ